MQYFSKPVLTRKFNLKSQYSGIIWLTNNRPKLTQNRKMSIFFVRITKRVIHAATHSITMDSQYSFI